MDELPTSWVVAKDPPDWLTVSASELASLREWFERLKIRTVHLSGDVISLAGGAEFGKVISANPNPELAAIKRALLNLDAKRIEEEQKNRDRGAEASESLRQQFGKGYTGGSDPDRA